MDLRQLTWDEVHCPPSDYLAGSAMAIDGPHCKQTDRKAEGWEPRFASISGTTSPCALTVIFPVQLQKGTVLEQVSMMHCREQIKSPVDSFNALPRTKITNQPIILSAENDEYSAIFTKGSFSASGWDFCLPPPALTINRKSRTLWCDPLVHFYLFFSSTTEAF